MEPQSNIPPTGAGFTPVTPVGDAPILSLVPPIQQGDQVRHPDPLAQPGAQQPLPTNAQVPVAPVRRRMPVTPLIQLPGGAPIAAALAVAPIIPGQSLQPQPLQAGMSPYGVQPTTFPFQSAPAFQMQMPYGMTPYGMTAAPPMPMQTYVAYVTLITQPPPMQPYFHPAIPMQQYPGYFQPQYQQPSQWPQPQSPQQQWPQQFGSTPAPPSA